VAGLGKNAMANRTVKVAGNRVVRGERMARGKGWRLIPPGGRTGFKAVLKSKTKVGGEIVALFRVLPHPDLK
jgi:hypothetical protein